MKTFYDLKALCNELQERQNKLLELHGKHKEDTEIIREFNKLQYALETAYQTLTEVKQ